MPLRARVGRHASTGRNCQNWKDDQQKVIALLNSVPIADGGADRMLKAPVVPGVASQELFTAILYFQNKHFSGKPSGFIDPAGPELAKLESLAARPAAPPPKEGQWDNLKSSSVNKALRKALADLKIEHDEVVDLIRATLSDGTVSAEELDDLLYIAETSRTISPRSQALLRDFYSRVHLTTGGKGPYKLPSDKHQFAANMVCDFLKRSGKTYFPKLHRDKVGLGILMRIANPNTFRQGDASLCGPAAMLHSLASDRPGEYARFAMDLFEEGKAKVGRLFVKPGPGVRDFLPEPKEISQADWLTMASLRDSENWFFDYDDTAKEFAGITLPDELRAWFRLAGYRDIINNTNLTNLTHKGAGTVDSANELFDKGYRVCLFISANMLDVREQALRGDITTRHWVVQRSKIDLSNKQEIVRVFTWGQGDYKVPETSKELSADEFLGNFYGYVAAKA